jgi:hypothetical protein
MKEKIFVSLILCIAISFNAISDDITWTGAAGDNRISD